MVLLPRPPKVQTTSDYIAQVFTLFVVSMLMLIMLAVIVLEALSPNSDTTAIVEAESEILKLIVGALIGYLAGRGAAYESSQIHVPDGGGGNLNGRPPSILAQKKEDTNDTPS